MHKAKLSRTVVAAVLALGGLAAVGSPAQADGHNKTVVLTLILTNENSYGSNTDNTPGSFFGSTGTVEKDDKSYGSFVNACQVESATPRRLMCMGGFRTPDGQIGYKAITEVNFQTFPAEVTGGTQRFRNASGDMQFGPSSGGVRQVTIYLSGVKG
ncbi:hypothetical protein [Streptomyces marianii]|uniref:hypothetical protein n=1 Tax=Streptomyces marianii TaxID=1817406 RepID=UPI0014868C59|nr:hypothetical protein [Streptomyces marianii]